MKSQQQMIMILVAFVLALVLAYYLGTRSAKRETFDASKIKDPKVRSEMEYLKKMYFS